MEEQVLEGDTLLTVAQVMAMTQISRKTLWKETKAGNLPMVKIGRSVRYRPEDVEKWLAAGGDQALP